MFAKSMTKDKSMLSFGVSSSLTHTMTAGLLPRVAADVTDGDREVDQSHENRLNARHHCQPLGLRQRITFKNNDRKIAIIRRVFRELTESYRI